MKSTIGDHALKDWYAKKDLAKAFGISIGAIQQQYLNKNWCKKNSFPMPSPTECTLKGNKKLFSSKYMERIEKLREERGASEKGATKSALNRAVLKITVPVFEQETADFLLKKFGGEAGIDTFLREKLAEVYKPTLAKLQAIEDEYQQKKAAALAGM